MSHQGGHLQCVLTIEEELKESFHTLTKAPKRDEIIQSVTSNDDVEFYWLIATTYFQIYETKVHQELLYRIVELYVTVRGFSYASAWLEKYKGQRKVHSDPRVFAGICTTAVYGFQINYMLLQCIIFKLK